MGPSATVSVTVKVATPPVLLTAVITELPVAALKLTVLPDTGLPAPSFRVTVMVEVLIPFAATDVGLALTVMGYYFPDVPIPFLTGGEATPESH